MSVILSLALHIQNNERNVCEVIFKNCLLNKLILRIYKKIVIINFFFFGLQKMPPMKREASDAAENLTGAVASNTQNPALAMRSTTLRILATSEDLFTGNIHIYIPNK